MSGALRPPGNAPHYRPLAAKIGSTAPNAPTEPPGQATKEEADGAKQCGA
jgi:hypothetical protein